MVRLQPHRRGGSPIKIKASQFHYGSITTVEALMSLVSTEYVSIPLWFDYNKLKTNGKILAKVSLNSTMVRLQLCQIRGRNVIFKFVSIPLWFDYNGSVK